MVQLLVSAAKPVTIEAYPSPESRRQDAADAMHLRESYILPVVLEDTAEEIA